MVKEIQHYKKEAFEPNHLKNNLPIYVNQEGENFKDLCIQAHQNSEFHPYYRDININLKIIFT